MIKAGIIGATGYAGAELARLLLSHPEVEVVWLGSRSYAGQRFSDIFRNMEGFTEAELKPDAVEELAEEAEVVFTATPQGYLSQVLTPELLTKTRFIDLSADYRLKDVATYEAWYGIEHGSPDLIRQAVYGLVELHREEIPGTRLLANPGCYTTCSILTVWPLLKEGLIETDGIVVDALSGVSGAGRGSKVQNLFCEVAGSVKAYGVATHRHTPEIEQELSLAAGEEVRISFTPHLVPMDRGILVTAYGKLKDPETAAEAVAEAYRKHYQGQPFLRLLGEGACPETRWVRGSNLVDLGWVIDRRLGRIVMMGALDNLGKGAAGQAVQNMNLMFGFPEDLGLSAAPVFP